MSTPLKALMCAWLAFHLVTMCVSMGKDTSLGKSLRPWTDPYQWRVGVHQNWTMYAPDPRRSSSWVEFVGVRQDKTEYRLPILNGRPDPEGAILVYARAGKLERNAVSRKHLRASFVRWYCRTTADAGDPVRWIRAEKVAQRIPAPDNRAERPRSEWPERRTELETWNCR